MIPSIAKEDGVLSVPECGPAAVGQKLHALAVGAAVKFSLGRYAPGQ